MLKTALKNVLTYILIHNKLVGSFLKMMSEKWQKRLNVCQSSIRWVDLYDTVYVLSDEAYEKYLMFKDEALKKDLFDVCQTPRITRFYDAIEISRALAMKYRLKRLGINDGRNYGSGQTIDHIMRLMQKMSEDGLLVMTSPSGEETYVRSLNKTELKKWIRSHMMLTEQYRFLWSNRKG